MRPIFCRRNVPFKDNLAFWQFLLVINFKCDFLMYWYVFNLFGNMSLNEFMHWHHMNVNMVFSISGRDDRKSSPNFFIYYITLTSYWARWPTAVAPVSVSDILISSPTRHSFSEDYMLIITVKRIQRSILIRQWLRSMEACQHKMWDWKTVWYLSFGKFHHNVSYNWGLCEKLD